MMLPPRIGIIDPASSQAPFLEYNLHSKRWRVWLAFNEYATLGTYLDLYPEGLSERVTDQGHGLTITRLTGPVVENKK